MTVIGKNIDCDTQRLYDDAKDIIDLVTEYEKKIEIFFDRLDFTPKETTAWVGGNAHLYSNTIVQDKPDFIDFGEKIKALAKEMQDFATELDDTIDRNEDACENSNEEDSNQVYW